MIQEVAAAAAAAEAEARRLSFASFASQVYTTTRGQPLSVLQLVFLHKPPLPPPLFPKQHQRTIAAPGGPGWLRAHQQKWRCWAGLERGPSHQQELVSAGGRDHEPGPKVQPRAIQKLSTDPPPPGEGR